MELAINLLGTPEQYRRCTVRFRPAGTDMLTDAPSVGIPGFVPWSDVLPTYYFATVAPEVRRVSGFKFAAS